MKTPDTVSKLRQKLYKEQAVWNHNVTVTANSLSLAPEEDKPQIRQKLSFYRTNLLKCNEQLCKVKRGTIKQQLAGWH